MQLSTEFEPVSLLRVPGGYDIHLADSYLLLYFPGKQFLHGSEELAVLNVPGEQVEQFQLPVSDCSQPPGQSEQPHVKEVSFSW